VYLSPDSGVAISNWYPKESPPGDFAGLFATGFQVTKNELEVVLYQSTEGAIGWLGGDIAAAFNIFE